MTCGKPASCLAKCTASVSPPSLSTKPCLKASSPVQMRPLASWRASCMLMLRPVATLERNCPYVLRTRHHHPSNMQQSLGIALTQCHENFCCESAGFRVHGLRFRQEGLILSAATTASTAVACLSTIASEVPYAQLVHRSTRRLCACRLLSGCIALVKVGKLLSYS